MIPIEVYFVQYTRLFYISLFGRNSFFFFQFRDFGDYKNVKLIQVTNFNFKCDFVIYLCN